MDKDKVSDIADDISRIARNIDNTLVNEDLTSAMKMEYKQVLSEAQDVENAIGLVSASGFICDDIQSFKRGAVSLRLSINSVFVDQYCLNFSMVVYRELVCYIVSSKSNSQVHFNCKWGAKNSKTTGSFEGGLFPNSARCFYDNRDNIGITSICLTSVICD